MTFAEKSKQLRVQRNLTQAALGKALHLSRYCICMLEIGRKPTEEILESYSKFFEIPIDDLHFPDPPPVKNEATEEQLLLKFRKLGEKVGFDAQILIISFIDVMLDELTPRNKRDY